MDNYEFIKLMEQKKQERMKSSLKFKPRDVYFEIHEEIKKDQKRIFVFYGLRGIGKSITINQLLDKNNAMFIDGTILSYYNLELISVVREYLRINKFKNLFIDELSDIPNWDNALKILYDNYDLKIIATGSSAISLRTKNKNILRRAIFKEIAPFTFREYLRIKYDIDIKESTKDIFISKPSDAYIKAKSLLLDLPDLTQKYREYLKFGYPLTFDLPIEQVSEAIVEKIIVDDFPHISGFNIEVSIIAKNIINTLSISKPDRISLSTFADGASCSRTTVSNILEAFSISSLIIPVLLEKRSSAKFRKEPKYLFSSSSIRYGLLKTLVTDIDVGPLREDAVVSAFKYAGFTVNYLEGLKKHPDYKITFKDKSNIIEVGGPSKNTKQLNEGFLLIDDDKLDYVDKIVKLPLFLVGLL